MIKRSKLLVFTVLFMLIAGLMISCGGDSGGSSGSGPYTIGVTVTGVCCPGLVLQNNGGDDLSVSSNGVYTFATALSDGASYNVTVKTQPKCQTCTVSNSSGTISGANVANITVTAPGFEVVTITDSINTDTTWEGNKVYVIEEWDFHVNATLTVESCTIVKFNPDEGRSMTIDGNVIADGTAARPIIFTSFLDDSHGCDTNGDGDANAPAPGDWNGVYIQEDGSQLNYCEFYYGGDVDGSGSSLDIDDSSAEVTNCIFAHNSGCLEEAAAALNAEHANAGTQVTGNIFYDNQYPMLINTKFDIDNSNVFHNPADSSETNAYNGIFIDPSVKIDSYDITWAETEVPFVIDNNDFWVEEDYSLTLADNVIIKFTEYGKLTYYGDNFNNHDGTGVYFTSYKDDAHGGDTNGDGPSSGAFGDWSGIIDNSIGEFVMWDNILYDSQ